MELDSMSIQKKEFHIVFKGYKPEEVDKFLDLLASEFERLQRKNKELQESLDNVKYEGDNETLKMKKVIQDALVSAHRVAEEIKYKAKKEAENLINQKKLEEEEAYRRMVQEKESLQGDIDRLKEEYADFKRQVLKFADDFKNRAIKSGDADLSGTAPGTIVGHGGGFKPGAGLKTGSNTLKETGAPAGGTELSSGLEKISGRKPLLEKEETGGLEGTVEEELIDQTGEPAIEDLSPYKHIKKEYRVSQHDGNLGAKIPDSEFRLSDIDEKKYGRDRFTEDEYGGAAEGKNETEEEIREKHEIELEEKNDIELEEEQKIEIEEEQEEDDEEPDEVEDEEKQPGEKRNRKKIDIANPDIINDFFKTDD